MTYGTSPLRLVADIGGTNARFALLDVDGMPARVRVLECSAYPDIGAAIQAYLAMMGGARPVEAVIAIANPVTGDHVAMTNHHWSFSVKALQAELALDSLLVVNDFAALAMSLPFLGRDDVLQVGGEVAVSGEPIGVIGPGTGLGVAGLVKAGNTWHPLPGEGGHVTLPAANAFEADIISILRPHWGHVSAERILSGPGISSLRVAIGTLQGEATEPMSPAEITRRALAGEDPLCRKTIMVFCAMLGTVAGNLALTLGARGGVYLGGGILPRLGELFLESPFRARFEDKGRFTGYLASIPCYVIRAEQPALIGASHYFGHCREERS
jgi:glucokinase